jgi:acetoin utilization protein AcuB
MIVRMWMSRDVVAVEPRAPITEAASLMNTHSFRRLPVVVELPEGTRLIGIISATDLFHAFPSHVNPFSIEAPAKHRSSQTVADIMTHDPITTVPDAPIEEAARIMHDHKIGGLPVLQKGKLVGIITSSDIFRAFVRLFELPEGGVRITFDLSQGEDVLGEVIEVASRWNVRVVSFISSHQDDRPVGVLQTSGGLIDRFLDELWKSGHPVLNVLRPT